METTSTGIALVCSKGVPYLFALALSGWTLVYGEREKAKAERLAAVAERLAAVAALSEGPPASAGH